MKRGEIRWCEFGRADKRRPVLILTRDSILEYLGEVTVAPITSTVRGIPSEVTLAPSDGVPKPSAINLDHVQTISSDRVGALIAPLRAGRMREVRAALLFALGF
jgi:mRNA interferase MazF